MDLHRAIAISITAILLVAIIGATAVTAKNDDQSPAKAVVNQGKPTPKPTTPRPTTIVPTTVPTTVSTNVPTLSPSPSVAELQARLDGSIAAGNARLAAMQAAYRAWAIPTRKDLISIAKNVRNNGLKKDGTTDNTAALQSLLNSLPAGATVYFPVGKYRIDGPVSITKPVTIFGDPGTILYCQKATRDVFNINKGGSLSSKMSGVTITGLVIEGPGEESLPQIFYANCLQSARFSYVKFHNIGVAGIRLNGCADTVVDKCIFDNFYHTGYGYGVSISDYSDNITVRDCFFVTKGRHGVTTGTANSALPIEGYTKRVFVENNYFEGMELPAIDSHRETTGPYVARGNVVYNSYSGVGLRGGIADISNNVIINCLEGIRLNNLAVDPANIGPKIDNVAGNTLINMSDGGGIVDATNSMIKDNVIQGQSMGRGLFFGPSDYSPAYALVTGNVLDNWQYGFYSNCLSLSGLTKENNWLRINGVFQDIDV